MYSLLFPTTTIPPHCIRLALYFESHIHSFDLIGLQMATRSAARRTDTTRPPSQAPIKNRSLNINAAGLLAFPDELLLEMMRHMPRVPVSCHTAEEILSNDTTALDSQFTLTALSQTCRRLRRFFLPYVYRTIEVLDGIQIAGRRLPTTERREKQRLVRANSSLYTKELVRQLEAVTVCYPSLAQYVVGLNVVLTISDHHTLLARKVWDYLSLLPNLRSVRMDCQYRWISPADVKKSRLPQIRHVHLNDNATTFALSCPNLVSFSTSHAVDIGMAKRLRYWYPKYSWKRTTPETKRNVEVIGVNCGLEHDMSDFPNLRDMSFECLAMRDIVRRNREIKNAHLEAIRIQADQIGVGYIPLLKASDTRYTQKPTPEEEERWISWCEETLRQVQRVDGKNKKIYYTSSSGTRVLYLLDARNPTQRRVIEV
ncbi:hypothetical protein BJ165DRAFT_1447254 [Panaeolus papilionaceus]|nr:hypothetical protein BJ165DRAFT_1447254 [Panaeolus papilionaceus]